MLTILHLAAMVNDIKFYIIANLFHFDKKIFISKVNLADKMPIQHWMPILSQEFKVFIDITCIYDRVLLIHLDTCNITHTVLQTTTLTPPLPPHIQPWVIFPKSYNDLMHILLFLAFLFIIFISDGFLLQFYLRLTLWSLLS